MAINRSKIARQLLQEGGVSVDDRSTANLIDSRMNRSYDENRARNEIQREMGAARRSGNFRDFLLKNVGAGGASMYGDMYDKFTGTYQSMRDSVIDQIYRQRMNAPEPGPFIERDSLTGLPVTDMLPGIPGMRSLAEEDAIRRRVLEAQMNESGRTFADGKYANEAEAIADLGLERYNQLFSKGGEVPNSPGNTTLQRVLPRKDGQRPGFFGPDMGEGGKESDFGLSDYSTSDIDFGGVSGGSDEQFEATAEALGVPKTPRFTDNFRANTLKKQLDIMYGNTTLFGSMNPFKGPSLNVYNDDFLNVDQYGMKGSDLTRAQNIQNALNTFQDTGRLSQTQFEKAFGAKGPTTTPGGDNEVIVPKPIIPKLPTDIEPEKSDYDEFVQRFTLPERFRLAEGGEPRQAYGLGSIVKKVTGAVKKVAKSDIGKAALLAAGAYFAPAAFGGTAGFGAGSTYGRFFSGLMSPNLIGPLTKAGEFGRFLSGTGKGKAILGILGTSAASGLFSPKEEDQESIASRIADRTGIDVEQIRKEVQEAYASGDTKSLRNKYPFLIAESAAAKAYGGRIGFDNGGTMMASNIENDKILENLFEKYLDMGLSPKDAAEAARQEFDRMSKKQDTDRTMAAGGGMMNPNDEMLNLGGNEMDLRGGGFVPLGEYEKKDDVPARLSKNEFVFTADAVRAAGGGSVDRGADLMYKTMKQLENKVV